MAIGNREEKKLKNETLGYSFTHHSYYEVVEDEASTSNPKEIAFQFGAGCNEAVITYKADEAGQKSGITFTLGKTNVKVVTAKKTYNMIAAAGLSTAATAITNSGAIAIKISKGGYIDFYDMLNEATTEAFAKTLTLIPDGGFIAEPILGISINATTPAVGYFNLYY